MKTSLESLFDSVLVFTRLSQTCMQNHYCTKTYLCKKKSGPKSNLNLHLVMLKGFLTSRTRRPAKTDIGPSYMNAIFFHSYTAIVVKDPIRVQHRHHQYKPKYVMSFFSLKALRCNHNGSLQAQQIKGFSKSSNKKENILNVLKSC